MKIFLAAIVTFAFNSWGTTFSLQTIDQQLKEADGVVVGHFLKSHSVILESETVATQMIFKVQEEWGLQSDTFGLDEVIIHYPGGQAGDLNVQVQGVPKFIVGERVTLLIKNVDNRYWGLNLGFGSFRMVSYGKETVLVNTLFPMDVRVGQIGWETFNGKVREVKGSGLKTVKYEALSKPQLEGGRYPASIERGKKRAIASKLEEGENKEDRSGLSMYWLVAVLALFGGLFRYFRGSNA